jgi:hypothetical protein
MPAPRHLGTTVVRLPGERGRLRQLILYVAQKCETSRRFGAIKLNKIIWKADFDSFATRGVPVTGREYKREKFGPVPREMRSLHTEMLKQGAVRVKRTIFGLDEAGREVVEHRTIAQDAPNMSLFTPEDISFVEASIAHYWE